MSYIKVSIRVERLSYFIFDELPDDSSHLVSIEFSDWVLDLDFSCSFDHLKVVV